MHKLLLLSLALSMYSHSEQVFLKESLDAETIIYSKLGQEFAAKALSETKSVSAEGDEVHVDVQVADKLCRVTYPSGSKNVKSFHCGGNEARSTATADTEVLPLFEKYANMMQEGLLSVINDLCKDTYRNDEDALKSCLIDKPSKGSVPTN